MKLRVAIIALLGIALTVYLVMYAGIGAVFAAVGAVGWGGFGLLCLYGLGLFIILGGAWYVLLPASPPVSARTFIWARMVRDAASDVLPFSQLGGIVLGARVGILNGVPNALVYASTVVDVTTEMLAQIAYVALGLVILDLRAPATSFAHSLMQGLFIGLVCAIGAAGVFLALQRHGQGLIERLMVRILPSALGRTAAVSVELKAIYRSRSRVAASSVIHFVGWIASAASAWIAFRLIGARVDPASVLAIESVVCATRSAAVFIPHALGVQEAAYVVLSPLFGIGPEIGLAVSLLKRARDLGLGVPTLLVWQAVEGHRARSHPTRA